MTGRRPVGLVRKCVCAGQDGLGLSSRTALPPAGNAHGLSNLTEQASLNRRPWTWDPGVMPRSQNDQCPATYVVSGVWPMADLAADAPPSAHYSQALVRRLNEAIVRADISLRALGERAGVSHGTISRLKSGQVLPDIGTLARLETALGAPLWARPWDTRAAADMQRRAAVSRSSRRHVGASAGRRTVVSPTCRSVWSRDAVHRNHLEVLTKHPELVRSANRGGAPDAPLMPAPMPPTAACT